MRGWNKKKGRRWPKRRRAGFRRTPRRYRGRFRYGRRLVRPRYSRQRTGPGRGRISSLRGTTFFGNVYMTASDQLQLAAGKTELTSAERINAIRAYLPADPLTLRLNTGISCFPKAMTVSTGTTVNTGGAAVDNTGAWSILCNICSGIGVYASVINARPPEPAWTLTPESIGVDLKTSQVTVDNVQINKVSLMEYNGANRVMQWGQYGQLYDRYRVDYLIFEYVPSCGRMTDGQVTMLWNDNPTDRIPSTMGQFLTNTKCITTQVYNRARLVVKPRRWLWTQPQAGGTGVRSKNIVTQNEVTAPYPDRTVDCGWFAVCARGASQTMGVAGTIRLTYAVRFAKPSMNLEYVKITQQEGGNVIVEPRGEMVQPAMPAATRNYPQGLLSAFTVPTVPPQPPDQPAGRSGDIQPYLDEDVPYDEPDVDGQAGSLVVGGGGNLFTTDDRWGSNMVGNPLYYYTECMASGGGDKPDNPDIPDIPDIPINPDDPSDNPAEGPMLAASKMVNLGYYYTNSNTTLFEYHKFTFQTYQYPGFWGLGDDYSLYDSGYTPMTPCSVLGLMTMSADGNFSTANGTVFCIMGPNLSFVAFSGNVKDNAIVLPKAPLVLAQTNQAETVHALTGSNAVNLRYPSLFFYAQALLEDERLQHGGRSCGIGHDCMIVFMAQSLSHYGVTYIPSMSGHTYGVFHPMPNTYFPLNAVKQESVTAKSASFRCDNSYVNVPIGDVNVAPQPGSQTVNWLNIPRKQKIGVRLAIKLSFARVAYSFGAKVTLYAAVGQSVTNSAGNPNYAAPSSPFPHFNALFGFDGSTLTWPLPAVGQVNSYTDNNIGYIGQALAVGEYRFDLWGFNTFGGNKEGSTLYMFDAPTGKPHHNGGPNAGNGTAFVINGVITPDQQFNASSVGIVAGLNVSVDWNPDYNDRYNDYTDYCCAGTKGGIWETGSDTYATGVVFTVKAANLIYYDATNVPENASTQQLEAYLQANPQSVLLSM